MDDQTINPQTTEPAGVVPTHEQTKERIKKLAMVGTALNDTFSEENQDYGSDFALAKTSLESFLEDIEAMDLPEPSKQGMRDLVAYLNKKIEKRANASIKGEDHFD